MAKKKQQRHNAQHGLGGAAQDAAHPAHASVPPQTLPVRERQAAGRALALQVPLKDHATWRGARREHDPIDLLIDSSQGRVESLVPTSPPPTPTKQSATTTHWLPLPAPGEWRSGPVHDGIPRGRMHAMGTIASEMAPPASRLGGVTLRAEPAARHVFLVPRSLAISSPRTKTQC